MAFRDLNIFFALFVNPRFYYILYFVFHLKNIHLNLYNNQSLEVLVYCNLYFVYIMELNVIVVSIFDLELFEYCLWQIQSLDLTLFFFSFFLFLFNPCLNHHLYFFIARIFLDIYHQD